METAIEKITREVAEMKAMAAAAAAKMTEAADTIRNNIGNSDALNQLADELEGAQVELQGGIDKLTPPAPPPPPAEPDPEAA